MEDIIKSLHDESVEYLESLTKNMDVFERQILFINCMKVFDKSFYDYMETSSEKSATFFYDILKYAYPVLIKYIWTKGFESLPVVALVPTDPDNIYQCRVILSSCRIVGQTEYIMEMKKYGMVSTESNGKCCRIKMLQNNYWIDGIEAQCTDWYEQAVFSQIQKDERIVALESRLPDIHEEMKKLCFVWKKEFMGYNGSRNVEDYFNDTAYYDAVHSTEWDYYQDDNLFGKIPYSNYTDTIIDLYGYAAKHVHFAGILQSTHPELLAENLLFNVRDEQETICLIQENEGCSKEDAEIILSCISVSAENHALFENGQVSCAPLIKVSNHQYLHSMAGSLFHPFSFLLSSLGKRFPQDSSKNVNQREAAFRKQLYDLIGQKFTCVKHNIVIRKYGKTITDIDAAMMDKNSGDIVLFQLKWQNQTVDSIRSLHSKSQNYVNETIKWVNDVKQWIESESENNIAAHLGNGIKAKEINKSKIYLIVLGRNHGNYSGERLKDEKTVWIQWYQLLQCFIYLPKDFTIPQLYNALLEWSPYRIDMEERVQRYQVGEYTFECQLIKPR